MLPDIKGSHLSKCMLYPVNIKLIFCSGNRDDIEPALIKLMVVVFLQKGFCGFADFMSFSAGDTFFRPTKGPIPSIAYLYKYQIKALPHDQVDFTAFSRVVAYDQRKPICFQIG